MAELILKHQVIYDTTGNTSISDIANSLLASERLLKFSAMVLEDCIDGFTVETIDVKLREISQQSPLKEILAAVVIATFQKDLAKEVPPFVEKILGVQIPDEYNTMVTVIAMIIAIYGVSAATKKLFPDKDTSHLKANYDKLVVVAGNYIDTPSIKIDNSINKNFSGSMKAIVQKTGIDFFRPAKKEGVRILGPDGNEISREAVLESPSDVDFDLEEDTDQYVLKNVKVNIRAVDKDRKSQGWAAVVSDVTEKRLKMKIDRTININSISNLDAVNGDIIVISKKNSDGDFCPYMYHLVSINDKS